MTQHSPTAPLTTRRTSRAGALLVASFGALLAFLDVTIVNVAFPNIRQSFPHSSLTGLSWVLNSYNIVFAALLVAAGRLADVFGRRRTFSTGIVVFTAGSALCAAAPTVGVLVSGRAVQALGAGLLVPSSLALVVEAFPIHRRSHAVGLWGATAAVASGLGPPLGGALVDLDNWRLAFLINLPLGLAALAATRRVLVESRAPGRRTLPDMRGAALLAGATALVTLGVIEGPTWGWSTVGVIASFVSAAFLLALFVQSSRNHPVPVLDPRMLRVPAFGVANVVTFVAGMGFYAYMLNNILWLHYVWGWSLLRSGLAVAPGAVVAAVVAGALGEVASKRGYRVIAVPGAIVWTGAYVWYAVMVGTHPDFLGAWLPGQILSGIGVGATLPIVGSAALAAVPGSRYATASAVVSSTRQLGAVLGIALLVLIIGTPSQSTAATAFRHGWVFSIVCFAVAALVATRLRPGQLVDVEETDPVRAPDVFVRRPAALPESTPLGRSPLLSRLPAATRSELLNRSTSMTCDSGSWLFRAGDPTDALYVVQSGRLDVVMEGDVVRELGAGDVVGELGVLTGAPRSAGVRARRDSVLARVTPATLDHALRRDADAYRVLATTLAEQLQTSRGVADGRSPAPRVLAVVAIGDAPGFDAFADALVTSLTALADVVASRRLNANGLLRAEAEHDRVVLISNSPDDDPWRAFCLRQADRVVFVAAAETPVPDSRLAVRDSYVVLVGAHPDGVRMTEWWDALSPRFSFVAAPDELTDVVTSLAARLAGRSIGVAIAGGGARSLAGIGVLEELLAAGFRVDRVAGCSVGGAVAALFATGRDPAAVDAACYDEFVRRNPFNDYRLPTVSLTAGHKTEEAIARQFGDVVFEELPRELVLVSTDLVRRALVVHRRGHVGTALRASLSLPGLYPPARIDNDLHVDGGVLDNLPVRPLVDRDEGPIVAVNIGAATSMSRKDGPPRVPSLGETLLRTMLMAGSSTLDEAKELATVVVTPDTRGVGLLEFHQMDRARDAGRAAGQAAVAALAEVLAADVGVPRQREASSGVIDLIGAPTTSAVP